MAKKGRKKLLLKLADVSLNMFEKNLGFFIEDEEAIKLLKLKTDLLQEIVKVLRDSDPENKAQIVKVLKDYIKGPGSDYAEDKLTQLVLKIKDVEIRMTAAALVSPVDDALRVLADDNPENLNQIKQIAIDHFKSQDVQATLYNYALKELLERIFKNNPDTGQMIHNIILATVEAGDSGFDANVLPRLTEEEVTED